MLHSVAHRRRLQTCCICFVLNVALKFAGIAEEWRTFLRLVFIELAVGLAVALPVEWNALHRLSAEELRRSAVWRATFLILFQIEIVRTIAFEIRTNW